MDNIGILKINELAEKNSGMIRFDKGSGKFPFPEEFLPLFDEVKETVRGHYFYYPKTGGEAELRVRIAEWEKYGGREVGAENVVVTNGGMSGLFTFFSLLTNPGDGVVTNRYAFEGFSNLIDYFRLQHIRTDLSNVNAVEKSITERTKVVILNSPENPTGKVYTETEVGNLVELSQRRKVWLLSDEVMSRITYGGVGWFGPAPAAKHVVIVNSFAKMWFLSGVRVGWMLTGDKDLADQFANSLSIQSIGVNLFGQLFITRVLKEIDYPSFLRSRLAVLDRRRNLVKAELGKNSINYAHEVEGGMNYYVDLGKDSSEVVPALMRDARVALIPGCLFEGRKSTFARLGFGAVSEEEIVKGIGRIVNYL